MANYTKSTDFASKDTLLTGDPNKVVKGTEIDDEFNNIQTAIGTKVDSLGSFALEVSGTDLLVKYNSVTVLKISSTGAVTAKNTVTAFGSL